MGLDLGINIKARTSKGVKYLADAFGNLDRDCSDPTEYEFTYWRNKWNIREKLLNALSYKGYDREGGYIELTTLEDLINVSEVFKYFLDEKHWEGDCWIYYVIPVAEAVRNFRILIKDIENEEIEISDLRIELYDSF